MDWGRTTWEGWGASWSILSSRDAISFEPAQGGRRNDSATRRTREAVSSRRGDDRGIARGDQVGADHLRCVGGVPSVSQLCVAPRQLTPTVVGSRTDQRQRLSEAVAAVHAGDGCGLNRSHVVPEGSLALSRATVAATPSPVGGWRE